MSLFKKFTRDLAANEVITVNATGNFFLAISGDAAFFVEPDGGSKSEVQAGIGFDYDENFQGWYITNGSTVQQVEFYIGDGRVVDNRVVISGGLTVIEAGTSNSAYAAVAMAAGAATLVKALNATRRNILVQNKTGGLVYFGNDASVTASNGVEVANGNSMTFNTKTALYAFCAAAGDVKYFEEYN